MLLLVVIQTANNMLKHDLWVLEVSNSLQFFFLHTFLQRTFLYNAIACLVATTLHSQDWESSNRLIQSRIQSFNILTRLPYLIWNVLGFTSTKQVFSFFPFRSRRVFHWCYYTQEDWGHTLCSAICGQREELVLLMYGVWGFPHPAIEINTIHLHAKLTELGGV